MTGRRSPPIHMGGPIGLAGLTLLAGSASLMVMAGVDREEVDPVPHAPGAVIETAEPLRPHTPGQDAAGRLEQVAIADAPEPDHLPARQALPASPPEPMAIPASAEGTEIIYIVRIKGAPEIDTIARNFKRDPATAHQAYGELCNRLPALREFELVGASYSGEIRLAYQLAPGVQPTRSVMNEIKDKIMAIEGVAYADPDFVAHPGEDRK